LTVKWLSETRTYRVTDVREERGGAMTLDLVPA